MEFTVLEVIGVMALAANITTATLWTMGYLRYTLSLSARTVEGDVAHIEKALHAWMREFFVPGTRVAFVASHPEWPQAGTVLTNHDTLDQLIGVIAAHKEGQ